MDASSKEEFCAWNQAQRQWVESGQSRSHALRDDVLRRLRDVIVRRERDIIAALDTDFGKPATETWASEIGLVLAEIDYARKHLRAWMKPQKVGTPLLLQPSSSYVHAAPLGRALIIGPHNYPFMLAITPLVAALAAGNAVLLKPSELTPATAALLSELLAEVAGPEHIAVAQGPGHEVFPLAMDFYEPDIVFFTGSTRVGRLIAERAARTLTPVVLELGGKSPTIVDGSTPLRVTARRIMLAKCLNAGQTCVAPDFVLVQRDVYEEFLAELSDCLAAAYGEQPAENADLARIVDEQHFERLRLLATHGRVVWGGQVNAQERRIAPTVLADVALDSPLMQEEIFGPLLPVFAYDDDADLARLLQYGRDSLALYVFSSKDAWVNELIERTRTGAVALNNAAVHLANPELPFGGVGRSGHGRYHGHAGFAAFSYAKSVLRSSAWFDPDFKYAPYTERGLALIKKLF